MDKTFDFYTKWAACAFTLVGALFTSLRWDPFNIWFLNVGSLLYLIWSLRIREWNLVAINAGLLTIYAVGLFIR